VIFLFDREMNSVRIGRFRFQTERVLKESELEEDMQKLIKQAVVVATVWCMMGLGQGIDTRAQEQPTAEQDLQRGRIMYIQQKFQDAIEVLKRALSKKPDLVEAYYFIGMCYSRMNDFNQAEAAFRDALKRRDNNYAEAHYGLALVSYRKRDYETAVRECQTAIEQRNGTYPEALNLLGASYYFQRKYAQAIESFRKSIEQRPEAADANLNLGMAIEGELVEHGTEGGSPLAWNDAINAYRKAIEQNAGNAQAHKQLGLALIGLSNDEAVLELGLYLQQVPPEAAERAQIEEVVDLLKKPEDATAQPLLLTEMPRISKSVAPRLTDEAIKNKVQGSVVLLALFCYDYRVRVIKVVKGLGYGLDERAIEAVKRTQFEPASVGGRRISERRLVLVDFKG